MKNNIIDIFEFTFNKLPSLYTYKVHYAANCIEQALVKGEPQSILDVGCGTGVLFTLPLAIKLRRRTNLNILGIDVHNGSIDLANQYIQKLSLDRIAFSTKSIESLTDKYNFICCIEVLEHLFNPSFMVRQLVKHLKHDGKVIITIPNGHGPFERDRFIFDILSNHRISKKFRCAENYFISLKKKLRTKIPSIVEYLSANEKEIKGSLDDYGFKILGTLNEESPHVQFFSLKQIIKIIESHGLKIQCITNNAFLAGPITKHILSYFRFLIKVNNFFRDKIPHRLASGWIIIAEKI